MKLTDLLYDQQLFFIICGWITIALLFSWFISELVIVPLYWKFKSQPCLHKFNYFTGNLINKDYRNYLECNKCNMITHEFKDLGYVNQSGKVIYQGKSYKINKFTVITESKHPLI